MIILDDNYKKKYSKKRQDFFSERNEIFEETIIDIYIDILWLNIIEVRKK